MPTNPRNHGYGDSPKVKGPPSVTSQLPGPCPHCGCGQVFDIKVEVDETSVHPMLRRPDEPHRVVGRYIGCAACPWASPMITSCELIAVERPS
jgi:hypothetical protein